MKTVILIDANHLISRTFHVPSFQDLSLEIDGRRVFTGATYGFLVSLLKIFTTYKGTEDKVVVVWDGGRGFRTEISPDYKANRTTKTEEFLFQLHLTQEFLRTMGVVQSQVPAVEADDIIGILAKQARLKGYKVLIISGDKDFNQLVSRFINVVNPNMSKDKQDRLMTPETVKELYGVPPELFVDYLALKGDDTDNVDGVEGVGNKTAAELILANGTIEDMIKANEHFKLDDDGTKTPVSKKLQGKINSSKSKMELSKKLVKIAVDLNVDLNIDYQKPNFMNLKAMFKKYAFKTLLLRFNEFVAVFS